MHYLDTTLEEITLDKTLTSQQRNQSRTKPQIGKDKVKNSGEE